MLCPSAPRGHCAILRLSWPNEAQVFQADSAGVLHAEAGLEAVRVVDSNQERFMMARRAGVVVVSYLLHDRDGGLAMDQEIAFGDFRAMCREARGAEPREGWAEEHERLRNVWDGWRSDGRLIEVCRWRA